MSPGEAKILTHAGLISIAGNCGYKKGWAAVELRKFMVWPGRRSAAGESSGRLWWRSNSRANNMQNLCGRRRPLPGFPSIDGGNAKRGYPNHVIITKASKLNRYRQSAGDVDVA